MDIQFQCPRCSRVMLTEAKYAGKLATCPKCKSSVRIPEAKTQGEEPHDEDQYRQTLLAPKDQGVKPPKRDEIYEEEKARQEAQERIKKEVEQELRSRIGHVLGIVGSVLLFFAVFTPIVHLPIVGSINYFRNGKGDGVFIIAFALLSIMFTLRRNYKALWVTGAASLAVITFTFINFQIRMSQAARELETDLADNPFAGLAELALGSVQLEWGWALLIIAVMLLFASATIGRQRKEK